jgi:hypothetical protein
MLMVAPRRLSRRCTRAARRRADRRTALAHLREQFDVEPCAVEVRSVRPSVRCYEVGPEARAAFARRRARRPPRGSADERDALDSAARSALLEASGVARGVTVIGPPHEVLATSASYRRDGA